VIMAEGGIAIKERSEPDGNQSKPKDSREESLILQQWQTCVEAANAISQRRDVINGVFVTLCLAVVTGAGAFWGVRAIFLLVAGIAICVAWLLYISSLKTLNSAKFQVIEKMESYLFFQPFAEEWELLQTKKRYVSGTTVERVLPISFLILFIGFIACIVCGG
jgi:hypothetical protein